MKTIIWAVDPIQFAQEPQKKVVELLKFLSKGEKFRIQPVYVVSLLDLKIHYAIPKLNKTEFLRDAETFLNKKLKTFQFQGLESGVAVFEPTNTLTGSVRELVKFARKKKASAIVCATRAKKGLDRFLLGSFAESLVFQSTIPHILINPFTQSSVEIRNILFSTDFSKKSKSVWNQLIPFAKDISAKIKLFHAIQEPSSYTTTELHPLLPKAIIHVPDAMKRHYRSLQKQAEKMVKTAKQKGVPVSVQLERATGSVAECVQGIVKNGKVDLLAMASVSGPISTELLGSTTRKMMRTTTVPFWLAKAR